MSDSDQADEYESEIPTPEGCRRYPPSGYNAAGNACTCEDDCPQPCNGVFCGCDACEDEQALQDHPTHHRPLYIACAIATAIGLLVCIPLISVNAAAAAGVFFGMIIAILVGFRFYCRSCRCARCGARLPRDPRSPGGTHFYSCKQCNMVWQSRIVGS